MRILIIDDDPLISISLRTIVSAADGIEVCAVGESGKDAILLFREHKPDIVLMDIRMEGISGLEAGDKILGEFPEAKILYLTTFLDDEYIVNALKIGACGYILKQHYEGIVPALRAVFGGQNVFNEEIAARLPTLIANGRAKKPEDFGLSEREAEIIRLVAEGLSNKEISEKLYLSVGTVRNYISIILDKLSLRDRTQLAVFFYRKLS